MGDIKKMADIINMKIVGVGGAGNNVVGRMISSGISGVSYSCINTDRAALSKIGTDERVQIGEKLTKGQGAGSRPEIGRAAAEENRAAIDKLFEGVDVVFLTAGMGGGTGTGAAPVVAEAARSAGALTIGVVSMPFKWEGARKMRTAEAGVQELLKKVDTLFVIPNDNIRKVSEQKVTLAGGFTISEEILLRAVGGIAQVLRGVGFINLDFADMKNTLKESGLAHLGIGEASGKSKVEEAAATAMQNLLMETSVEGAKRLIVNVNISQDTELDDVTALMDRIEQAAHDDANIIFGCGFDENLVDAIRVIVIATDYEDGAEVKSTASRADERRAPAKEGTPASAEKKSADDEWEAKWKSFFE